MMLSCERTIHGAWRVSAIIGPALVTRMYYGYTKEEAMRQFKIDVKERPMLTVCTDCTHYRYELRNPSAPNVWYNHRCAASIIPFPPTDPVTGDSVPDEYEACRTINDGNCAKYVPKLP